MKLLREYIKAVISEANRPWPGEEGYEEYINNLGPVAFERVSWMDGSRDAEAGIPSRVDNPHYIEGYDSQMKWKNQ